jgi:hypothetical protein
MSFGRLPPTFEREAQTEGEALDETYRMLGREHERDLEREARRRGLAAAVQADRRSATARGRAMLPKPAWRLWRRLCAFLAAEIRAAKEA